MHIYCILNRPSNYFDLVALASAGNGVDCARSHCSATLNCRRLRDANDERQLLRPSRQHRRRRRDRSAGFSLSDKIRT